MKRRFRQCASLEWEAGLGPRGRCLWASYHTGLPDWAGVAA